MNNNVVGMHNDGFMSSSGKDPQDIYRDMRDKTQDANQQYVDANKNITNDLGKFADTQLGNPENDVNRMRQAYQPTQADQQRILNSIMGEKFATSQQGRSGSLSGMGDVAMAGQLSFNEGLNNYVNQVLNEQGIKSNTYLGAQKQRLESNQYQQSYNQNQLGLDAEQLKSYANAYYAQQSKPTFAQGMFGKILGGVGGIFSPALASFGNIIGDKVSKAFSPDNK